MLNKKRNLEILILILFFTCFGCKEKRLQPSFEPSFKPSSETGYKNNLLLKRLTSVEEGERFKALDEIREKIQDIDIKDMEGVLTSLREKMSAL